MAEDDKEIRGDQAERLVPSGQDVLDNLSSYSSASLASTDGVPSPDPSVDDVPLAGGQSPSQRRRSAEEQALRIIRGERSGQGNQGRSPDPRVDPDAVGTGSSSLYRQEDPDPRRSGDATPEREAFPSPVNPPHYFKEQPHQVFYHDAIVYIEGQDVSDYLIGSISVTYGLGSSPNKCDLRLDNSGHKFTLTPENIQLDQFRTVASSSRSRGAHIDYDETAKKEIYDRKKNPGSNPVDPQSGGRRFPLHYWSSIFHKQDHVRVWIHNPASDSDEWLPVFTGLIVNKPTSENYITGENIVSVSCSDIRHIMHSMRVNTNTVLAVLPGQQATAAADPTNTTPFRGLQIFREQSNVEFSRSFFQDLVVSNNYTNPWVALKFREMIAALTFIDNAQGLVARAGTTVERRIVAERRRNSRSAASELHFLRRKLERRGRLSDSDRDRYNSLLSEIEDTGVSSGDPSEQDSSVSRPIDSQLDQVRSDQNPESPPGTEGTPVQSRPLTSTSSRGAGRIGRMRPGVYPWGRPSIEGETRPPYAVSGAIYPRAEEGSSAITEWWEDWYNLCLFGSPKRINVSSQEFGGTDLVGTSSLTRPLSVRDGQLDQSPSLRRYWSEDEVHAAGVETRREGLWAVDAQTVNMIYPSRQSPTLGLIDELGLISQSNAATNLNWTNRLHMISDACDKVDYRFWVSGTGDLIFEFAQYDFDPRDYGPYKEVLTLDHHLLSESFDEEGNEITTAVVANGSFVGRADVSEGTELRNYNPAKTVGVWSPSLASRHGIKVQVRNYFQITSIIRLEKLAMLEFQKLLAAADNYQISLAFRPWLLLNKPIFNAYRERYALIDSIRWSLPVTSGSVAGSTVPDYSITLNYTRSIDELGIPRFITGGPSQPMFFGERRGGAADILTSLSRRISTFSDAISSLRDSNSPITQADLSQLRDQYNAILPQGQSSYNVVSAAIWSQSDLPEGAEDEVISTLQRAQEFCTEIALNSGSFSQEEINEQLEECARLVEDARSQISDRSSTINPTQGPEGTNPDRGRSGVRSTLEDHEEVDRTPASPPSEDEPCFPGDPNMFSHPLGRQSLSVVPKFADWFNAIDRDLNLTRRRRSDFLIRYARGDISDPLDGISSSVGIFQTRGAFPRIVTSSFGRRGRNSWHPGVDLPATLGDFVYSVADGIVINIVDDSGKGQSVGILHKAGYATFYRHLKDVSVSIGDEVKRNQSIAKIGMPGREATSIARAHLHFECAAIAGSEAYSRYVGAQNATKRFFAVSARQALISNDSSLSIDEGTSERSQLLSQLPSGKVLASTRCVSGIGNARNSIGHISPDLARRFSLSFLRSSSQGYQVPRAFLFYSPSCVEDDPFAGAELRGGSSKGSLVTQRQYFEDFLLKGIPTVTQAETPSGLTLDPIPELPSNATERQSQRILRQQRQITSSNERKLERLERKRALLQQQIALYRDAVPPDECPPSSYEGTVPRQPGEPLDDQRRIRQSEARAAYRRRTELEG